VEEKLVLWLQDIVLQLLCRLERGEEERRDSSSATEGEEEGWRAYYGQIELLPKELEMPLRAFSYVR